MFKLNVYNLYLFYSNLPPPEVFLKNHLKTTEKYNFILDTAFNFSYIRKTKGYFNVIKSIGGMF